MISAPREKFILPQEYVADTKEDNCYYLTAYVHHCESEIKPSRKRTDVERAIRNHQERNTLSIIS